MTEPRDRDLPPAPAPEEQPEPRRRFKTEEELNPGKNYKLNSAEAHFEFDPANHQSSEEGGEPQ